MLHVTALSHDADCHTDILGTQILYIHFVLDVYFLSSGCWFFSNFRKSKVKFIFKKVSFLYTLIIEYNILNNILLFRSRSKWPTSWFLEIKIKLYHSVSERTGIYSNNINRVTVCVPKTLRGNYFALFRKNSQQMSLMKTLRCNVKI